MSKRMVVVEIDCEDIRKHLLYQACSGKFFWTGKRRGQVGAGVEAGTLHKKSGYLHICFNGKKYLAHRLAWFFCYGKFPSQQIDHINGDKLDNRISNLRDVSGTENQRNSGKSKLNRSGYKGVSFCKRDKRWRATIRIDKKQVSLGYFDNPQSASIAYQERIGSL